MSAFQPESIRGVADALIRMFTVWFIHPREKGMTYTAHLCHALSLSRRMAYGSLCLAIHSVFPFWFETVGSDVVRELYRELHPPPLITVKEEKEDESERDYSEARAAAASVSTPRQCGFNPALAASDEDRSIPPEGKGE